jgi:hypothetical protein
MVLDEKIVRYIGHMPALREMEKSLEYREKHPWHEIWKQDEG